MPLPPAPSDYARRMPRFEECRELVEVGPDCQGRPAQLAVPAAKAWQQMRANAAAEGLDLLLVSAFRSVAYQEGIVSRKLAKGLTLEQILQVSAYPGHSEHHTGRAVDLAAPGQDLLTEAFAETPQFDWLCRQAGAYGFVLSYPLGNAFGLGYEPWHWCFRA